MLPGKKYAPEDVFWIAWRRKWLILVPSVVITCATVVAVRFVPDRYRSQTLILVEPQKVSESYVRATVTSRLEDQLQSIQTSIMSSTRLEKIIDDFNLYPDERARLTLEDVIERMRTRDIQVTVVKGDAFRIAYSSDNPKTAQAVAQRIAQAFQDESLSVRQEMAQSASDFLQMQLNDARRRLMEKEKELAEYQRAHAGQLPAERQANLQALNNLQMQLQNLVDSINRDKERRVLIERDLKAVDADAQIAPPPVVVPGQDPTQTGTTAARLEAAQALLRNLLTRYKDDHPDVARVRRQIQDLEKKAAAEALEKPLSAGTASRPATPEEAARQKKAADLRASLDVLDVGLQGKTADAQRLREQLAAYQGRLEATPLREAEMIALSRDYETLKQRYESLLAKQEDSKMSASLETRELNQRFSIVDPARYPERPYSPNRPLIDLIGALVGLGLGIGLAAAVEYRDRSLRTEDDAVRCLALPVLALVPVMTTASERRHAKRMRLLASCGVVLVVLAAGAGAVAWRMGWLDSLRQALQRAGL